MFKILAVICTLGGDCSSYVSEPTAMHPTLSHCERKARRLATDLLEFADQDPEFGLFKVGCVDRDYTID